MKRKIVIELYEQYDAVNYYVFRFKDEEESEFDKFFNRFDGEDEYENSFDTIMYWLDKIGNEGADIDYFRPAGKSLKSLPIDGGKLRLYCFRVSDCIVFLGNGGHKKTRTYNEDPLLNKYVCDLREVGRQLLNRFNYGSKTTIYNCKLMGELEFEIESEENRNDDEK